jgi:cytochrome c peroxidase
MRQPRRDAAFGASSRPEPANGSPDRPPPAAGAGLRPPLRVRLGLRRPSSPYPAPLRAAAVAFALASLVGVSLSGALRPSPPAGGARQAAVLAGFARPTFLPHPADNPTTPAKVALGKRLFQEVDLSATGTIACASCHDPRLAFADGESKGRGVTGRRLARHTPSLWNVAFAPLLFWDGRAASLEEQVHYPIENPDEMGSTLAAAAGRLGRRNDYLSDFARAFPDDPQPSPRTIAFALAAYERTLISPPTRFDQFVAGEAALSASEQRGFAIFAGKGRCVGCHSGPTFTDHNFYDIGLPGEDRGRGAVIALPAADYAFKTPTLRELAWSAPYMHDGSLATLDEVVRHYERGGVRRATRSSDLPANLRLSEEERGDLVAFLETLSSDEPPQPSTETWIGAPPPRPPAATHAARISQVGKTFTPSHIRLSAGETLTILNDDSRTHNVRIHDPRLHFNSGAQEPRETVEIPFPDPGSFEAFCAIHPSMRLRIEVEEQLAH